MSRRVLALGLVALGIALIAFWQRDDIVGYCLNKPSYSGKYSTRWKRELDGWIIFEGDIGIPNICYFPTSRVQRCIEGASDGQFSLLWRDPMGAFEREPPAILQGDDCAAIPVLIDLLNDDDPKIRAIALFGLARIGPSAQTALPDIQAALGDSDSTVRQLARFAKASVVRGTGEPVAHAAGSPVSHRHSEVHPGQDLNLEPLVRIEG